MSDKSSNSTASTPSSAASLVLRPVAVNSYQDVRPVLQNMLYQLDYAFINKAEEKSGLNREKLFCLCASFVMLLLVAAPFNMSLSTFIGVFYPLCATISAVSNGETSEHLQWLVYWSMFAFFSQLDFIFCFFMTALLPVYVPLKTIFLLHLALPQTYGAHNLYVKYLHQMVMNAQKILRAK